MAQTTITRPDMFPTGTTVGAYPKAARNAGAAPSGSAVTTATATATGVVLTGLTENTEYVAYALVSSEHRYIGFRSQTIEEDYPGGMDSPANYAAVITPHDSTNLSRSTRAIYVGTGGDISVETIAGETVVFQNTVSGTILPVRVKRVNSTNTTAADLVGLA